MLYLIQSDKYVKIGYAQDLQQRMKTYQTHNPNLKLLGVREGDIYLEKYYHYIFRNRHIKGEWFDIPDYIVEYLIKHHFTIQTTFEEIDNGNFNKRYLPKTVKQEIKLNIELYNLVKSLYTKIVIARITHDINSLEFTNQEEQLLKKYKYYNPKILEEN